MTETSLVLLPIPSAILGNFRKMFGNDCLVLRQLLENLQKSLESLWKSLGNHQKSCHYYVYINNNQNNTWLLVDIEFLFPCLTWYLTHLLHSLARYQVEHSTRNSISTRAHVLFSILTPVVLRLVQNLLQPVYIHVSNSTCWLIPCATLLCICYHVQLHHMAQG